MQSIPFLVRKAEQHCTIKLWMSQNSFSDYSMLYNLPLFLTLASIIIIITTGTDTLKPLVYAGSHPSMSCTVRTVCWPLSKWTYKSSLNTLFLLLLILLSYWSIARCITKLMAGLTSPCQNIIVSK